MKDFANRMREQAMSMGDRARREAMKRKEDYLGARVSRELRARVIARADELGIPVSILIRNVLEQAFMDEAPRASSSSRPAASTERKADDVFAGVLAWERIVLNRGMNCGACAGSMAAGTVATLGIAAPGEEHVILCAKCKEPV
ncbi:MAG: hypothetical protein RBT81_09215 [Gammaproteobacteria bacterium]|jgi:hypothetical protein|nr:hypothetical protein [Gammaproteobacteria bacterium]